jgi:hypothetical protein
MSRLCVAVPIAALLALASAPAAGDMTKDQCVDDNGKAQELRREGKLSAAREQLRACANLSCPTLVRDDCNERLDELERAQPTIAFEVKTSAGADLIHVRVSVDGEPLVDHLDGKPMNVDPGAHLFKFEMTDQPSVARRFVLTEGEKGRRERIIIIAPISHRPTVTVVVPPPPQETSVLPAADASSLMTEHSSVGDTGTQQIFAVVAGGVGVAGIAVGSVFGLLAGAASSQQRSDCPSSIVCPHHATAISDHSAMITDATIANVGFIGGGALLATAAVLFFSAGDGSPERPSRSLALTPSVGVAFASLSFDGRF